MENVKKLLEDQQKQLQYYFEHVALEELEKAVSACEKVKGLIVLTGVGKSGIIAEKIAMTLVSTGTKALYLPPTNLLHGDLGILSKEDLLILISRSGQTQELIDLIPFVRQKGAALMALISNPSSRLAKLVDLAIHLPVDRELCPFNLAPTTSTTVQLLFGDLLTIALMERKQFSLEAYALNHPAGAIGKKMTVYVEDVMFQGEDLPLCSPEARVVDVLVDLSNKKCGALIVVSEEKELLGIFTDGDLRRALQKGGASILSSPIKDFMTQRPIAVQKGMLAIEALKIMQKDVKKLVAVLPVLKQNAVVGVLRMHDIIQSGIA